MKSEKEVVSAARDRRLVEIQFRDLPREQDGVSANPKHKEEKKEVFTKVVIRRLPPSLTKDQLEEHLSPLPAYDYFEFFSADQSLYPHLFSRAYINFKNPEDIVLFRDRFDGYVFIDNKGQEFPAVVEFAPFQKVSKKKVKKKDAKAGSIEEDPEYRRFLENCCDEEKTTANPETLLGEIEAKTRELIAKRTTPLLEYIKNKKLEKQRIREEKREERRRRELEKKRLREEEKRKRREEERRKRKEAEKQKKLAEKEIKIKVRRVPWHLLSTESGVVTSQVRGVPESDKEQREHGRRPKDPERHRGRDEERKRQRHHYEFEKLARRKDETKWGKGYCQDRARREGQHHGYACGSESGDKAGKDERDDLSGRKERIRNKDRPAMQLYTPGARSRTRMSSAGNGYDCCSNSPERGGDRRYEVTAGTGSEKSGDE
uniref:UPF3A regulator of nonsense mediated mRNA decay n=1 Tax=Scleropages formosus TaxID=113540 RepID=A0A8C9SMM0_SCLFO